MVTEAAPFLKWAGGKSQLLSVLLPAVPAQFGTYVEPFVGGGALFFRLRPKRAVLADANQELIGCYTVVRDRVEALIGLLATYPYEEGFYYRLRSSAPADPVERAARLIYLNRTCYNGLYRVNRRGQFNVPFGRHANPVICDADRLRAASQALAGAELYCADYRDTLRRHVRPGDFVYLDPPYHPISRYSDFKRYTPAQFGEADQRRLAEAVRELAGRGVQVLASNSDCDFIAALYAGLEITPVAVRRSINKNPGGRAGLREVIIRAGYAAGGDGLPADPIHGQQAELPG